MEWVPVSHFILDDVEREDTAQDKTRNGLILDWDKTNEEMKPRDKMMLDYLRLGIKD